MQPVKVVYMMAYGRSGSTVVGNILGEIDGFVHVGELRYLWARILEGRLCGCSAPVAECPLWSRIVPGVLEDSGVDRIDDVLSLQRNGVRIRYLRALLRGSDGAPPEAVRYEKVIRSMYERIARATGSRVIVDTSKRIADAAVVGWPQSIQPYFLQLVRDPRAVAYSWRRMKSSPGEDKDRLHTLKPSVTARSWSTFAAGASLVRRHHRSRSLLVRYEDFAARPRDVIEELIGAIGEAGAEPPFVDDRTVELRPNHTVGGNPVRFDSGRTAIRGDDEWAVRQSARDRLVVTTMTLPFLLAYGYPLRPRPEATRDRAGAVN